MATKIPAVAYYRMSSDKQETSIADQRIAVEEYAQQNNYRLVREYVDEGISGWKSEERIAFQSLIADAEKGDFAAVLCWDQDRFSRFPVLEANHYWFLLDRAGVHIATVAQGRLDFADLGEWLKASVVQHGKAEYCKDLSRNVCRGMREKRQAGYWLSPAPFGYEIVDSKLKPNGDAELVRRIFQLRLAGYGTHLIAKELNNDDIKTPRGSDWQSQSVRNILVRVTYVGDSLIGNFARGKFNKLVNQPQTIKDTHPAIVSRQTFDAVQRLPKLARAANGRGGSSGARLSGLMFCGRCGGKMYSLSGGNQRSYYLCTNYSEGTRRKGEKCGHCAVNRSQFEDAVFNRLRETILKQDSSRLEAAIQRELDRRVANSRPVDRSDVKRQIAKLDRQIDKGTEQLLLIDADLLPGAQAKLRELKDRRDGLEATTVEPRTSRLPSADEIADQLWSIDETLRTAEPVAVRHLLRQMVEGIVCDFDFDKARSSAKRKRYRFAGAEIVLRSSESEQLPGQLSAVASAVVRLRRSGREVGPLDPERDLSHGQSRTNRSEDAGNVVAGDRHTLRPGPTAMAAEQRAAASAATDSGRGEDMARRVRRRACYTI